MNLQKKFTVFLLVLGDTALLYGSLFGALALRYGGAYYEQFINLHAVPFSTIFVIWILVFYVAGLYDLRRLRNNLDFLKTLWLTILVNGFLAIALFYLIPAFGITPKTNLFIFIAIFAILITLWRRACNARTTTHESLEYTLLIGQGGAAEEIHDVVSKNPQIGYVITSWIKEENLNPQTDELEKLVHEESISAVVVPRHFKKDSRLARAIYNLLGKGVEVHDITSFYEFIFRKVPLAEVEEAWFLENLSGKQKFYDDLKRGMEFLVALIMAIVLLPLELFLAALIKITSPGPVIYSQKRIGKNNKVFTLYKFRTMRSDAEKNGAEWSSGKHDSRVTFIGKILRHSHLDELPQLVNILRGELSFVGPRPERPEFVSLLDKEIPHYAIRHLIAPGITGWAQINYRYGASVEDAYEKLQYDFYYLKNRSLMLDAAIVLKTFRNFFVNQK